MWCSESNDTHFFFFFFWVWKKKFTETATNIDRATDGYETQKAPIPTRFWKLNNNEPDRNLDGWPIYIYIYIYIYSGGYILFIFSIVFGRPGFCGKSLNHSILFLLSSQITQKFHWIISYLLAVKIIESKQLFLTKLCRSEHYGCYSLSIYIQNTGLTMLVLCCIVARTMLLPVGWVLSHINLCRLFIAKSILCK